MHHFVVPDDSGLIALYDPETYRPFIDENWTLEDILGRFRESATERSLLIWATGAEGNWRVAISLVPVAEAGFREVVGTIETRRGKLFVTSYDSLTMAAQFENEKLPQPHETEWYVPVDPGVYRCRVLQMYDPDDSTSDDVFEQTTPHFIIELLPTNVVLAPWQTVPWLEL